MSKRTIQKGNYLSADTVQELNDQHGWFKYEDAQSDVSRAFANNAVHVFLEIAIEAEQIKQETGMSPRELAEHISDLESRIAELESETTSLKKGAEQYEAWCSIMEEVDRRAYKEHCLEDKCDFTVTVTYEDYLATCTSTFEESNA